MKFILMIICITPCFAGRYLNFDFGAGLTANQIANDVTSKTTVRPGATVYSDIIHEINNFHIGLMSHINFAQLRKTHIIEQSTLPEQNSISIQSFFGIHAKYFFKQAIANWPIFISASYGLSILSTHVEEQEDREDQDDDDRRILYEGRGLTLGLGLQNGRNFYQLLYHRAQYHKASLVTGELKRSDVLQAARLNNNLEYTSILLIWSFQLF